jgi:hypothetical protein
MAYVFYSTKLEKRAEQVLPGSKRGGGNKEGVEGSGEKVLKNTKKNDLIVLKRLKICNF